MKIKGELVIVKILLSVASFFPQSFGGGEVYVWRLARELLQRDAVVKILTAAPWERGTGARTIERYFHQNIEVMALRLNPESLDRAELFTGFGPVAQQGLAEILGEVQPDIVHINGLKPAMTAACRERGIPHVVTAHHPGIACAIGTLVRSSGSFCEEAMDPHRCVPCASYERWPKWYTGGLISRMPPSLCRPLGGRLNAQTRLSHLGSGLIYPWLVERSVAAKRKVLDLAGSIIAPSAAFRDFLLRNGRNPETLVTVPHGVEPLQALPPQKPEGRPVRFGYVGRIEPLKGLHIILDALELMPEGRKCELHVFGAAQHPWDETYLKNAGERYRGAAQVAYHGFLPPDRMSEAYAKVDVLVVPSLWPEAFGLVVAEAFSARKPVIVFDSGALPELVTHGMNGFVVKQRDSGSLCAAMREFVDDPGLVARMSENVPPVRTVRDHVDDLMDTYESAMLACAVANAR